MKKTFIIFIIIICILTLLTGAALADALDAMSYFTDSKYNRSFTDEDELEHTIEVTWVGETWNKTGTVIYSINYEETYHNGEEYYTLVDSATEIYENEKPTYPDSNEFIVCQVKWYQDGSKEVICDYRTAETVESTLEPTEIPSSEIATSLLKEATNKPELTSIVTKTEELKPTETPMVSPESNLPEPSPTAEDMMTVTKNPSSEPTYQHGTVYEEEDVQNRSGAVWGLYIIIGLVILLVIFIIIRKKEASCHENS